MRRCKRGHLRTQANTYIYFCNGVRKTACRACHAMGEKLRYRNDAAFREQKKAKNLERYHEQRAI